MRLLVKVIVPHDRMQRFDTYWLEESADVQLRIEKGFLEFIEYEDTDEGDQA
jgi:hypothetical protein